MRFVLPHGRGLRPRWMLRAGLFLYDRLGGARSLPASASVDLKDGPLAAPLRDGIGNGFAYSDCVVDDARLTIANARDAARRGAEIHPRTEFLAARRDAGVWRATLRTEDGGEREAAARILVNVAGPWVPEVSRRAGLATRARLRLDKGSHIVVPRLYEHDHAYLLQNDDRRVVFVIPYERGFTLVGTTEIPAAAPPADPPSKDEIAYLCRAVGRWFRCAPEPADVVWGYSGLRPLYDDGSTSASAVSRDYVLELDEAGAPALSVFGGKLTTYRRLAEHALRRLAPHLPGLAPPWTQAMPLPDDGARLGAGNEFGPGLGRAEVEFMMREEWARTADDILWRRSKLGLAATPEQKTALAAYLSSREAPAGAPATQTAGR
jgi:glycerol-3-phosphate dehydrogenase